MISEELFAKCAADLDIGLPDNAFGLFDAYAARLTEYNQKVNLTAITDPDEIVIKHFADSLYFLKYVNVPYGSSLCDVGTGAGFPGMCLKLARPDLKLTLFDSVNKKLEFLRSLCAELNVSANIVHMRAEDAGKDGRYRESFDFVTARAVAGLNRLCEYCIPLVRVDGVFAPLKAPVQDEERRQGSAAAAILGADVADGIFYRLPNGDEREILIYKKVSHTSRVYPRVPAQIAKSPLG